MIKYETFIIKTFDQVKKHNFDQVNFGQVIISPYGLRLFEIMIRTGDNDSLEFPNIEALCFRK